MDSWNPKLYDGSHSFVSKFGNELVDILAPKKGEKILDVGCGTGDLANQLDNHGAQIIGIDQSEKMVKKAKSKYPHIQFIVKDVLELDFQNEFDGIFSNATLHWVKSPKEALSLMYQSLKPGGRFVAEFGGEGNIQTITTEITRQLKNIHTSTPFPWYFPSIGEYATLMEDVGFRVVFAQHFDCPTPLEGENGLRNWMEMFAGKMFEGVAEKERVISNVENNLRESLFRKGQWWADYKRIRVAGIKE